MKSRRELKAKPSDYGAFSLFKTKKSKQLGFVVLIFLLAGLSFWKIGSQVRRPFLPPEGYESTEITAYENILDQTIDTDGDGLSDYDEIYLYGTSPYLADTDGDGISDYDEIMAGTDPLCPAGQDCLLDNYYNDFIFEEELSGLEDFNPDLTIPEDFSEDDLQSILAGMMTPDNLRDLLINSGMEAEVVNQMSDEDLMASYEEALNSSE